MASNAAPDCWKRMVTLGGGVKMAAAASAPGPPELTGSEAGARVRVTVRVAFAGTTYTPFWKLSGAEELSAPPVIASPVKLPPGKAGESMLARNQALPAPRERLDGVGGGCRNSRTGKTAKGDAGLPKANGSATVRSTRSTQCATPWRS